MNIQDAVSEAVKIGGSITRLLWGNDFYVTPTDLPEACFARVKGQVPHPRWQPKAEDLMANDWEVISA